MVRCTTYGGRIGWFLRNMLRSKIGVDRNLYPFCRGCDFVDAGIWNEFIKKRICNEK